MKEDENGRADDAGNWSEGDRSLVRRGRLLRSTGRAEHHFYSSLILVLLHGLKTGSGDSDWTGGIYSHGVCVLCLLLCSWSLGCGDEGLFASSMVSSMVWRELCWTGLWPRRGLHTWFPVPWPQAHTPDV